MLKRRPFGNTGLEVSELILGAGYVGGIVIHADDGTRRTLMRRLIESGINWIDTAESYGQGASEEALGWLLAEMPENNRPYISSLSLEDHIQNLFSSEFFHLSMSNLVICQRLV